MPAGLDPKAAVLALAGPAPAVAAVGLDAAAAEAGRWAKLERLGRPAELELSAGAGKMAIGSWGARV